MGEMFLIHLSLFVDLVVLEHTRVSEAPTAPHPNEFGDIRGGGLGDGMSADRGVVVGRVFVECGIPEFFYLAAHICTLNHGERNFSRFRNRV